MFADPYGIPLSAGSLVDFNRDASAHLAPFEGLAREWLTTEPLLHADETGLNVDGNATGCMFCARQGAPSA